MSCVQNGLPTWALSRNGPPLGSQERFDVDFSLRSEVHQGEEVSMSLELQGSVRTSFGKAHSLVLRVPWALWLSVRKVMKMASF